MEAFLTSFLNGALFGLGVSCAIVLILCLVNVTIEIIGDDDELEFNEEKDNG